MWKALPKEYGSASVVHAHFQRWQQGPAWNNKLFAMETASNCRGKQHDPILNFAPEAFIVPDPGRFAED
jgi:transposase